MSSSILGQDLTEAAAARGVGPARWPRRLTFRPGGPYLPGSVTAYPSNRRACHGSGVWPGPAASPSRFNPSHRCEFHSLRQLSDSSSRVQRSTADVCPVGASTARPTRQALPGAARSLWAPFGPSRFLPRPAVHHDRRLAALCVHPCLSLFLTWPAWCVMSGLKLSLSNGDQRPKSCQWPRRRGDRDFTATRHSVNRARARCS